MTKIITLTRPIPAHGQDLTQLELREPSVEDVMDIGTPQLMIPSPDGKGVGIEIRANVIGEYIARLGGIPRSSVKRLSIKDFQACQSAVMGFFTDSAD